MTLKDAIFCLLLSATTLSSHSLVLGRAKGAALIGQPLQMSFSVTLDPGQSADNLCAEADVFYADTKVDAQKVLLTTELGSQPDIVNLRVQSSTLVDEPVVTIYLKAGCGAKTLRRFVLLADYATDVAPVNVETATTAPPVANTLPKPLVINATTPPSNSATVSSTPQVLPSKRDQPVASPRPSREVKAKKESAPSKRAPEVAPIKPPTIPSEPKGAKLRLDPLENLSERVKTLETTTAGTPLTELLQDSQRIQQLQSDMKSLLEQAAKNDATMLALRMRLDQAESERLTNIWTVAILALTVLGIAAGLLLWSRREKPVAMRSPVLTPATADSFMSPQASAADEWSLPRKVDTSNLAEPIKRRPIQAQVSGFGSQDFVNSVSVSDTEEKSESELMSFDEPRLLHPNFNQSAQLDLLLQADFFLSLGNTSSAIEVLLKRIEENPKDCPLVYLRLLEIATRNELESEYLQVREEFCSIFNAEVPDFDAFENEGRSLEAYPELLKKLTNTWPSVDALEHIENCVRHSAAEKAPRRFELAAFRELVLLHGLVRNHIYRKSHESMQDTQTASFGSQNVADSEHISLDL